jgi:predicted transcriptional regulator
MYVSSYLKEKKTEKKNSQRGTRKEKINYTGTSTG